MGTWEMKVTVNGETTIFNPDVAMSMDSRYGESDIEGTERYNQQHVWYGKAILLSFSMMV